MRPTYETEGNRSAQNALIKKLAEVCIYSRVEGIAKRFYPFDAIAYRGQRVAAFVEVKVRTNPSSQYPTYMLSLKKFTDGVTMARICQVDYVIAVAWTDCAATWRYRKEWDLNIQMGGRADRGDSDDVEPVIHIPIQQFIKL